MSQNPPSAAERRAGGGRGGVVAAAASALERIAAEQGIAAVDLAEVWFVD
jgi:hypothetical protein